MQERLTATLGGWSWLALFAVTTSVLVTNADRYLPPSGDRFVDFVAPGASDLIPSFNAAAALMRGKNPYHVATDALAYRDPYAYTRGEDQHISYLYPPSHALLYVPVVWLAGHDFRRAAQLHLQISLACLLFSALAALDLLGAMVQLELATRLALAPLLVVLMALNPGGLLGFERGQSDVITAMLCWVGVVAWRHGWRTSSAFLVVAATLLKGYALVLAVGMLTLGLRREHWRATLLGATAALTVLLAPVLRYLPDALIAYRIRGAMFWSFWYNQGFSNVLHVMGLQHDGFGRVLLVAIAVLATGVAWLQLRREDLNEAERALWLCAFSSVALISVLGYSLNSLAYDCVIVMPGALALVLGQQRLTLRWPPWMRFLVGLGLALALLSLFTFDFGRAAGYLRSTQHLPAAGAAELGLCILVGAVATQQLLRARVLSQLAVTLVLTCLFVATVLYGIKVGVDRAMQSSDLARGKPWNASSHLLACDLAAHSCGGGQVPVFFHTIQEQDPWFEIDLGSAHSVNGVTIVNREDCCQDNAIPLVIELSEDRCRWRQLARQDGRFEEWRARFAPARGRYVRVRVARISTLHLERVNVWGN